MSRFNKFAEILGKNLEGFQVKFKNESTLMRLIGFLIFFNKAFMTGFITTVGRTVYWTTKESLEARSETGSIVTLAHEYQHAKDADHRTAILFGLLYLFPQVLAAPGLLLALASPVWITLMLLGTLTWTWWLLPFILTLLFLTPIPAPWRTHYELKGYTMSLFATNEFLKEMGYPKEQRIEQLRGQIESKNMQFTSGNYYFMWPFGVEGKLHDAVGAIISEEIMDDDPIYPEIAKAIRDSK